MMWRSARGLTADVRQDSPSIKETVKRLPSDLMLQKPKLSKACHRVALEMFLIADCLCKAMLVVPLSAVDPGWLRHGLGTAGTAGTIKISEISFVLS